jgi:hypothetical protein
MSIEGKLQADFSSYYDAVDKAIAKQRDWDADAAKVEQRLNTMTDGFSGRRVQQEAILMAKAIQEAGGVTSLTDAELRRAGSTALEASEKMKKLGVEVPPGIQAIADASLNLANRQEGVTGSSDRMRSSLRQVDNIFGLMGVSIIGEIKGLEQMVEVSGKTAEQLGNVATAGALTAAAMGGWTLGRKIAEFFDLDNTIAGATARLMGWGDLAGEKAAAQADVLAMASANAGRIITNMTEAIKINEEAARKHANTSIDWSARMNAARDAALQLTTEQIHQIQTARELGATTEQLRDKYGVTADTLKALDAQLSVTTNNEKKMAEAQRQLSDQHLKDLEKERAAQEQNARRFAAIDAETAEIETQITGTKLDQKLAANKRWFDDEVGKLNKLDPLYMQTYDKIAHEFERKNQLEMAGYAEVNANSRSSIEQRADFELRTLEYMQSRTGEFSAAQIALQRETWLQATDAVHNWQSAGESAFDALMKKSDDLAAKQRQHEQEEAAAAKAKAEREKPISMSIQGFTKTQLENEINSAQQTYDPGHTHSGEYSLWKQLDYLEGREGTYAPKSDLEYMQMIGEQIELSQLRQWASGRQRPPKFDGGVENFSGGLAYVHKDELLVNMPKGTSVIPAGRSGGMVFAPVINVNAGLGDRMTIGQAIKDVLVAEFKSYGYRGPVPFGA